MTLTLLSARYPCYVCAMDWWIIKKTGFQLSCCKKGKRWSIKHCVLVSCKAYIYNDEFRLFCNTDCIPYLNASLVGILLDWYKWEKIVHFDEISIHPRNRRCNNPYGLIASVALCHSTVQLSVCLGLTEKRLDLQKKKTTPSTNVFTV